MSISGRSLVHFPIIHTQADMGSLSERIRLATFKHLGEKGWKNILNAIDKIWTEIERTIEGMPIDFRRVRLYQDGLPVCGKEAEIVEELADAGSRNHQLLLGLMKKGATIMGTESSDLLVEEYELVKQLLAAKDIGETARIRERQRVLSESLLERRDRYIAERINSTLDIGDTGILFLGMLHSLEKLLDKDIEILYPLDEIFARWGG